MNQKKFEEMMEDLETMDVADLEDPADWIYGTKVNEEKWGVYRRVMTLLLGALGGNAGVRKIAYRSEPAPGDDFADVTVTMQQLVALDKDDKEAFAQAAALCDRITMTTLNNVTRLSFIVCDIWAEWE